MNTYIVVLFIGKTDLRQIKFHRKSVKKIDLGLLILLCDSKFKEFFEEGWLYCQSEL